MKPTDLMVGDLVSLFDKDFARVDAIGDTGVYLTDTKGLDWNVGYDHIKPIPLTAEILDKNGLKKCKYKDPDLGLIDDGYLWEEKLHGYMGQTCSSTTPISIHMTPEGHFDILNPHTGRMFRGALDYVHELQHAFRICGIEKEIEL